VVLRYQCSPHHVNDAFHPVVGQIWHAAGFVGGEPAAARLEKLEKMIEAAASIAARSRLILLRYWRSRPGDAIRRSKWSRAN
jgi:hypothetical protein